MGAGGWKRSGQPALQEPVQPLTVPSGLVLSEGVLDKTEDFRPVPRRASLTMRVAQWAMGLAQFRGTSRHPAVSPRPQWDPRSPNAPGGCATASGDNSGEQDCSCTQLTRDAYPTLSGDTLL